MAAASPDMPDDGLIAPARLVIGLTSPAGPLASRARRLELPPTTLSLVNASSEGRVAGLAGIDPLREADSGLEAAASLSLDQPGPTEIPPGATARLTLTGSVPARPGRYATVLRVGATPPLQIPIQINIAAANRWGIGLMLLGLVVAGLLGVLSAEADISTRRRDAVQARQDIHNLLAANPPPLSLATDRAAMDAEFAAALAALAQRPPASIADQRVADAAPHLQAAQAAAARLRTVLANQPPGAAEVADLAAQWQAVRPTIDPLAKPEPARPAAPENGASGTTLAARLDAALAEYRRRVLSAPATTLATDVDAALTRAHLEIASGDGELAAARSRNQSTWLRRGIRQLDTAITGARAWLRQAGAMLNADRSIRAALARDPLPAADAAVITGHLDQAAQLLAAEPWPQSFADASHQINEARTALTTAASRASLAQFQQLLTATNITTDTGDIDRLVETLRATPHPTDAEKRAGLARVLALWRAHVAAVDDPPTKSELTAALDAMDATIAHGKLADLAAPYRKLGDDWVAWSAVLIHRDAARSNLPICRLALADLQRQLADTTASLQEDPTLDPSHALDRERDLLDRDVRNLGIDGAAAPGAGAPDCLTALQAVQDRASRLSGRILSLQLRDAAIADAAREQFAREAGLSVSETTATRRLLLAPATPAEDVVAGNPVAFTLSQADPNWGSAVAIHIDYGDHATLDTDAGSLRHGRQAIVHTYRRPGTFEIAVTARIERQPLPAGAGHNSLGVLRSPISGLAALADLLTNIRFAIALMLALIVYYWRFRDRAATFGARGFDYVEAFALGFAASAATDALPAVIAKLVV